MKGSIGVVFGRCGFGWEGGLFPNVRLGLLHVWCCRGSVFDHMARINKALAGALHELTRPKTED